MKQMAVTVVASALLVFAALPARAADMKDMPGMKDMPDMKMESGKQASQRDHKGEGTVNSVDFEIGHTTVQIEHGDVDVTCEQEPAHVV